jgi:hypothetical protein
MSRSPGPEWTAGGRANQRSTGRRLADRAQTEPFAALAAVAVVALALSVFAGAFEGAIPAPADRNLAEPAADRVERHLTVGGVVRRDRLDDATAVGPEGYRTNVTLVVGDDRHHAGPVAPNETDTATRWVSVGGDGDVDPGRLEVRVWT